MEIEMETEIETEIETDYYNSTENETENEFDNEFDNETDNESDNISSMTHDETDNENSTMDSDSEVYNQLEENTEDELLDLEIDIYENIEWYIDNFTINYSNPKFYENMLDDITQLIIIGGVEIGLFDDEDDSNDSIRNFVEKRIEIYFDSHIVPIRSYPIDYIQQKQSQENQEIITKQLNHLLSLPQKTQRTPEWYSTRYRLMTASNIYKVFGSQCLYNSFICEKCKPLFLPIQNEESYINTESSLHWGVKYEPLTQRIYEILYSKKKSIAEFGCIEHPEFECIGASPDGINIDQTSNHYGNMIEIKNIVNREINGIPSEPYWIQVQTQLEVCNLEFCDFVETRFKEYQDENK